MQILMTIDTSSGVWSYALELLGAIGRVADEPVSVTLATMGPPPNHEQVKWVQRLANVECVTSPHQMEWMAGALGDGDGATEWLVELAQHLQPDVVHLNSSHAMVDWGAPVCVTVHSCAQVMQKTEAPDAWNEYRRRVQEGLCGADAVVAPTRAMLSTIEHRYGLSFDDRWMEKRRLTIPYGCSFDRYKQGPKHPFVLTSGRLWNKATNLAALDEAAAGLPWRVYAAGTIRGPGQGENVMPQAVSLVGDVDAVHMRRWLSEADIYTAPSRCDSSGLLILEAALSECALVLGDIPGLREHWDEAAVFVPPNQPQEIREALQRLICAPAQRRKLAAAARQRALTFSSEQMATQYLELYREMIRSRASVQRISHVTAQHVRHIAAPARHNGHGPARTSTSESVNSC